MTCPWEWSLNNLKDDYVITFLLSNMSLSAELHKNILIFIIDQLLSPFLADFSR